MKLVCENCGGENIQTKAWVDPNTNKYLEPCECSSDENWCEDCEEHVRFDLVKEEGEK